MKHNKKSKLNIGIITFHTPVNYGAALQAYALKTVITNMGYNCEIIDYRWKKIEEAKKLFSLRRYFRKNIYKNIRSLSLDVIFLKKFKSRRDRFHQFMNNHMNLSASTIYNYNDLKLYANIYDIYIVGSDLVWNPEMAGGVNPAYFLDFVTDKTKIKMSYASSIGTSKINPVYNEDYKKMLKNLDAIAVREKTAKYLLESFTEKPIQVVSDPTLLLEKSEWNKLIQSDFNEDNYLLVYMVEKTNNFIKIVKDLSERLNLRIISFSKVKRFQNETNVYESGPYDFIKFFKNAKAVVTNSFHGVVFSLIYEKEFWCVPHSSRGSRMVDLITTLDIGDRIIFRSEEISDSFSKIDYKTVNLKIEKEKYISLKYLKDGIEKHK